MSGSLFYIAVNRDYTNNIRFIDRKQTIRGMVYMPKTLTRKNLLLYSFLLPLFLLLAAFGALRITPFGDRGLLFGDAASYMIKELMAMRWQVLGDRSILYSFSNGLGGNNIASLAYYLYPYSWFNLLSGWDHIELCFAISVVFVTSLYGLSMMLLLCDIWEPRPSHLIFSTCYALMGYSVVYNYCIVFFSGPLCLPVMVLGLRKIFRGESMLPYMLSIAYSTACHIQMGLIICITSVLFFVVKLIIDTDFDRKKVICRYVLSSGIGGLLTAVFWLPGLLGMIGGRASQNRLSDFTFDENSPILSMFSRLFSGAASAGQIINGLPAIFCGILPVFLVIVYFLDKENPKKYRIAFGCILLSILLTFYIRFFSTIVHGSHTNWFNFRNSFVFSFVLIIIAACEFERINKVDKKVLGTAFLIMAVATVLIFSQSYEFISGGNVVLDIALLSIMMAGLFVYRKNPEKTSMTTLTLLFLICTCLQLYVNYYVSMHHIYEGDWKSGIKSVSEYQKGINQKLPLVQGITVGDKGFYRMEDEFSLTGDAIGNDAAVFNYNGMGESSNLIVNKEIALNEAKFGMSFANEMWCSYDSGIPASMESLLGFKYIISPRDLETEKNYDLRLRGLYAEEGDIYQNPNALSIAVVANRGIENVDISDVKNVFQVQNTVWNALTGEERALFTEEDDIRLSMHNPTDDISFDKNEMLDLPDLNMNKEAEDSSESESSADSAVKKAGAELSPEDYLYGSYIEYEFVAKKTGPVYLYDSAAFVEGSGTTEDVLQYVGYFSEGDKVVGRLLFGYTITSNVFVCTGQGLHIAYADLDALEEYAGLLNSRDVTIEKLADHHLKGTVNAAENQRLFFTIPFEEGWTLFVDGKEAVIDKTCNLFMSTAVAPGAHTYELKFWPRGLTIGIIISTIAFVALIILCIYEGVNRRKQGLLYSDVGISLQRKELLF